MDSRRILVVDDAPGVRKTLCNILKTKGYAPTGVATGEAAFETSEKKSFAVALIDLKLGDMSGLKVLERLKQRSPGTECILLTGHASRASAIDAVNLGAYSYVEKPFDVNRLLLTVRRAVEKQQAEAEISRLAKVIEQAAVTIIITDLQGDIVYANPILQATSGYTAAEALGQNPRIFKSGQQNQSFYRELWTTIAGGETWRGTFINKRKDGSLYHEEATIFPIKDAAGEIINFAAVKQDITARVRVEDKLQQYAQGLEQRVAEKIRELELERAKSLQASKLAALGEMATGVAHELNQPLTAMLFEAEYLKDITQPLKGDRGEPPPLNRDELQEIGENIIADIARCRRLIDHLRAFGRVSESRTTSVNLNQPIKDCFILVGERLRGYGVTVQLQLAPDLPLILADPHKLEQVFLNLLSNAEHALQEMGRRIESGEVERPGYQKTLEISSYAEGRAVVAMVRDNGCGIPAADREHVFEPFFTTKPVGRGTGLGLSISYGIVTEYGGEISFESTENEGSSFVLRFPVSSET